MHNTIYLEHLFTGAGVEHSYPADAVRRRVYIFLTRHGFFFGLMMVAMLLAAVNYNNSMAYILVFLLASLYLVCMLHTYRNMRGLVISAGHCDPVFAGQQAVFPVLLDNRGWQDRISLTLQPWLKKSSLFGRQPIVDTVTHINVEKNSWLNSTVAITTRKRGYLYLKRLRLRSVYPLGLFQAWTYLDFAQRCLVYPQPLGDPRLPSAVEFDSDELTGSKQGTDEFAGFRDYRRGDSIRKIDWKALAREQGPLVKVFHGQGASRLLLHWDMTRHLGDTELRLSQLCLWILEAEQQGTHYQLELPTAVVEFGLGDQHKHTCLAELALYGINE